MCVSRVLLKDYEADTDKTPVEILDKRKQPIELMRVNTADEDDQDNYLWVKSKVKALKENSVNGLLSQRFEEGIHNKGGTKKLDKVNQRLGRLFEKYPLVRRNYDITITDDGNGTASGISCVHKTDEALMAHFYLGLLAFWLLSTIRYQLKNKGFKHQWKEIILLAAMWANLH